MLRINILDLDNMLKIDLLVLDLNMVLAIKVDHTPHLIKDLDLVNMMLTKCQCILIKDVQ